MADDKRYDPNVIPDWTGQYPPGRAHVRIEALEDVERTRSGKYQIRATLRGLEPDDVKDVPHFERFVIGTDDDPEANDPNSWKGFAGKRYKEMLAKAGVALTGSVAKDAEAAIGQTLGIMIANEVQKATNRDGSPNPYEGRVQASIRSFFQYGEVPLVSAAVSPPAVVAAVPPARAARPAGRPAAAPAVAAVPAPSSVTCSICNKSVLRVNFAAHVAAHEANEE